MHFTCNVSNKIRIGVVEMWSHQKSTLWRCDDKQTRWGESHPNPRKPRDLCKELRRSDHILLSYWSCVDHLLHNKPLVSLHRSLLECTHSWQDFWTNYATICLFMSTHQPNCPNLMYVIWCISWNQRDTRVFSFWMEHREFQIDMWKIVQKVLNLLYF